MEKEQINRLVELFKNKKIIVTEKGTLKTASRTQNLQSKGKITGYNKDQGKKYQRDGLQLSKKIFIVKLRSGELSLRGGKKNAELLKIELQKALNTSRIGENRKETYTALINMIDKYVKNLDERAKKRKAASKDTPKKEPDTPSSPNSNMQVNIIDLNDEPSSQGEKQDYIEQPQEEISSDLVEPSDNIFEDTLEPEYSETEKKTYIAKLMRKAPLQLQKQKTYFMELYNQLSKEQQNQILDTYFFEISQKNYSLINIAKFHFLKAKIANRLFETIDRLYDIKMLIANYSAENKFPTSLKAIEELPLGKQKKGEFDSLSFRQKYTLRLERQKINKRKENLNIFEKMKLLFLNSAIDEKILIDAYYNTQNAGDLLHDMATEAQNKKQAKAALNNIFARANSNSTKETPSDNDEQSSSVAAEQTKSPSNNNMSANSIEGYKNALSRRQEELANANSGNNTVSEKPKHKSALSERLQNEYGGTLSQIASEDDYMDLDDENLKNDDGISL